jgi:hypothetical protein
MRTTVLVVSAVLLLTACGIDFVAVEDDEPRGLVTLESEHAELAVASLVLHLSAVGAPPVVLLDGTELEADKDDARWLYRATPVVDTLHPRIELEIQAEDALAMTLPFVTRKGAAVWRPNGDLELPVAYGGDSSDPKLTWEVTLVDPDAEQSLTIRSRGTPLPRPIILPAVLIPTGSTVAVVTARLGRGLPEAAFPMVVQITSTARVLIPEDG